MLTHKIDTLIALTTFLKKCGKGKESLYRGTEGVVCYFPLKMINCKQYMSREACEVVLHL
jgi:hypothetical protein